MNKERAKRLIELLQAYEAGMVIQIKNYEGHSYKWRDFCWIDGNEKDFTMYNTKDLRVKPCRKWRPFKDMYECWQEVKRHSQGGWLKNQGQIEEYRQIQRIDKDGVYFQNVLPLTFEKAFDEFVFIDGTPFGKEEPEEDEQ